MEGATASLGFMVLIVVNVSSFPTHFIVIFMRQHLQNSLILSYHLFGYVSVLTCMQALVLVVVVDMAIAFLMGSVNVKMGTLALTVQLVIQFLIAYLFDKSVV